MPPGCRWRRDFLPADNQQREDQGRRRPAGAVARVTATPAGACAAPRAFPREGARLDGTLLCRVFFRVDVQLPCPLRITRFSSGTFLISFKDKENHLRSVPGGDECGQPADLQGHPGCPHPGERAPPSPARPPATLRPLTLQGWQRLPRATSDLSVKKMFVLCRKWQN